MIAGRASADGQKYEMIAGRASADGQKHEMIAGRGSADGQKRKMIAGRASADGQTHEMIAGRASADGIDGIHIRIVIISLSESLPYDFCNVFHCHYGRVGAGYVYPNPI